jgi:nucleoside-diphosphate-sugar epimerase
MDENNKPAHRLYISADGYEFVLPYIARQIGDDYVFTDNIGDADHAAMLSTCEVYAKSTNELIAETDAILTDCEATRREQDFATLCNKQGLTHIILRCPVVVGTGMNGLARTLVGAIARNRFYHVEGWDAHRLSVVHAVDIATATALTYGKTGVYNVTDGEDPDFDTLADALASRLNNKRVLKFKNIWWLRPLFNHKLDRTLRAARRYSCEALRNDFGFVPTSVTNYLLTHNYDENSL